MKNNNPKGNGHSLYTLAFESVMAVIYVCIAYLLLCTGVLNPYIAENFRLPLGIILAVYGAFRVYRAIRRVISVNNEK